MSSDEFSGIVPLISVFSALFSHVLTLMHDVEFFDDRPPGQSCYTWFKIATRNVRWIRNWQNC